MVHLWSGFVSAAFLLAASQVRADDGDDGMNMDMSMSMSMSMSMDNDSNSYANTNADQASYSGSASGSYWCDQSTSDSLTYLVDDGPYFSTCVNGTDLNVTSLFTVAKLNSSSLLKFCSSDWCMQPIHEALAYNSSDCVVLYNGTAQNLYKEVLALNATCTKSVDGSLSSSSDSSSTTKSGANVVQGGLMAAVTVLSAGVALLLA